MKRKTNLFYASGQDSNFLTFSNYTEAITGNMAATDWKIYPSRFICMYLPKLETNPATRKDLITRYLISYYENKLAIVKDWCIEEGKKLELNILSLEWLMEAIKKYDTDAKIVYSSEVTELDYNGVYSDTICIIDGTELPQVWNFTTGTLPTMSISTDNTLLNGWNEEELNLLYTEDDVNLEPIYDNGNEYNLTPKYVKISKSSEASSDRSIKFNIVIPVFDIIDFNPSTNPDNIDESRADILYEYNTESENPIDVEIIENEIATKNIPFGIWISDKTIELTRDEYTKYSPSWSLVISSQFKPFPYSDTIPTEVADSRNGDAFATYAQVLCRQNDMLNEFNTLSIQIKELMSKVANLENIVTKLNLSGATSSLEQEIADLNIRLNNYMTETNTKIENSILRWSVNNSDTI